MERDGQTHVVHPDAVGTPSFQISARSPDGRTEVHFRCMDGAKVRCNNLLVIYVKRSIPQLTQAELVCAVLRRPQVALPACRHLVAAEWKYDLVEVGLGGRALGLPREGRVVVVGKTQALLAAGQGWAQK